MRAYTPGHIITIESLPYPHFDYSLTEYRYSCQCGSKGTWTTDHADASDQARTHEDSEV